MYSHKDWPEMRPEDMQEELMNNIDSSLIWLLSPQSVYRYIDRILEKRRNGQPVSFTDIFGHLVGETLLKDVSLIAVDVVHENSIECLHIIM